MSREPSPEDVAQWMRGEVERRGRLFQITAVEGIIERFGPSFVYRDENGSPAIRPKVVRAFRDLTGDTVAWSRRWKYWEAHDAHPDPSSQPASD
jgi:hypothetical protein